MELVKEFYRKLSNKTVKKLIRPTSHGGLILTHYSIHSQIIKTRDILYVYE